jgi:putative tricarboxylic transport membrane protein
MKKGELIVALTMGLLGIWIVIDSYNMGLQTISNPGPGFFPLVLGVLLCLLVLLICIRSIRYSKKVSTIEKTSVKYLTNFIKPGLILACLLGYFFFLDTLGFPITTFFFLFILFWIGYPRKWLFISIFSVILVALAYLIFGYLLQTPFPFGFLGK